jgi:CheY-like chemotaxis protein
MNRFTFSSIRTNLTFWFLLLALLPLLAGVFISYRVSTRTVNEKTIDKLTAIRDLKVLQLEDWIDERKDDLNGITSDYDLIALKEYFESSFDVNKKTELRNAALNVINYTFSGHFNYEEIFVINAKTGIVEISTNPSSVGKNKTGDAYFQEPLKSNTIFIKDIYHSVETGQNTMTFSKPLLANSEGNPEIIGVVVTRIDLQNSLYPLLLNRTGLGKTGETLIVNKDLTALNQLRWHDNAPLLLNINAAPAVNASQGKTGTIVADDYRDIPVLSAYTYIPETGWGFVCKQDVVELKEPVNAMGKTMLLLFVISVVVVIALVYFVSKSIARPIVALSAYTRKIAEGDFSIRNTIKSNNEIGQLGKDINYMVSQIQSNANIQKGVAAISKALIGQSQLEDYTNALIKQLLKETGSHLAVFYALNKEAQTFEPTDSIGANKELLQAFSTSNPEGELGLAVKNSTMQHLKDLPADTIYRYRTSAGEINIREIITLPVVSNNNDIVGVISLGHLGRYDKNALEMLSLSANMINSSYTSLLANVKTEMLAIHLKDSNQKLEVQSEELQEQAEELQQQTIELQKGSDELQMQNQELEMQRMQVEDANRLKSEFLSNMSHELRTPLNSVNALSQILSMTAGAKLNDEENNYLKIITRNGKLLLSLINDILDLSKIEAGKIEFLPREINVEHLLNQVVEIATPLAEKKGLLLNIDLVEGVETLETDEAKLQQVLINVMGNAIKFTEKGEVALKTRTGNNELFIDISDTGIGISENDLPSIFDEFRQVDGSSARQFEGTGLGLAIVKKLTSLLGGSIGVKSKLGEGSVFTIRIPLKWENLDGLKNTIPLSETTPADSHQKTILVVDDDPKMVAILSKYLNEEGYATIGATSGSEALKLAAKYKPFAITLDIIMPDIDGFEVMQQLKANVVTRDIPVIIVSVSDDKETGLALGALGYISKPVNRELLVAEINNLAKSVRTIMVTDDNNFELDQMSQILETAGFKTLLAHSGVECLQKLEEEIPDLLILDLVMPETDGFEVLDRIRKKPKTQNLPVIIVTAKNLSHDEKIRLRGRVISVITKGRSTPESLQNEIRRIIAKLDESYSGGLMNTGKEKPRILMVEDNPEAVIQVKSVLETEGYRVDVASGGKEALQYIGHTIPDGIVLDLMMPEIDGFAVLEKIRGIESTKKIPVLVLTAKDLTREELSRLSSNNIQQLIHKGDINVEGLLFKIKLMMGSRPQVKRLEKTVRLNSENNKPDGERDKIPSAASSGIPERTATADNTGGLPHIHIIEDNPDNRVTLKAILQNRYFITESHDGETGLKVVKRLLPQLILMDMSLPKLKGENVVQMLKEDEKTNHIPVIAVTARTMLGVKEKFLAAGCSDFVAKPIDSEILLEKIKNWLIT